MVGGESVKASAPRSTSCNTIVEGDVSRKATDNSFDTVVTRDLSELSSIVSGLFKLTDATMQLREMKERAVATGRELQHQNDEVRFLTLRSLNRVSQLSKVSKLVNSNDVRLENQRRDLEKLTRR